MKMPRLLPPNIVSMAFIECDQTIENIDIDSLVYHAPSLSHKYALINAVRDKLSR
jgi:hypothetical protein